MHTGNLNLALNGTPRGGFIVNGLDKKHNSLLTFSTSPTFQIRWIRIKKGEKKLRTHAYTKTQALVILIKGHHEVVVGKQKIALKKQGDYVHLASREKHSWQTKKDTILIAIRW